MKYIIFFVLAFFVVGVLTIPQSFAQEPDAGQQAYAFMDDVIPSWIKNNAGWWADDQIDDFTFAQGIAFLIKNKIIQISDLPVTADGEIIIDEDIVIPSWIKNNAGWWSSDDISDSDFLHGIKYLVESNIIEFQSDNIEQHILDWDTIVNDAFYAYEGSIAIHTKFFDDVNYIVSYNISEDYPYNLSQPSLLNSGVWFYQITGNERFLQHSKMVADLIEESYVHNSGIVINIHPFDERLDAPIDRYGEGHTNQEILLHVAKLALIDSNYAQLTKT